MVTKKPKEKILKPLKKLRKASQNELWLAIQELDNNNIAPDIMKIRQVLLVWGYSEARDKPIQEALDDWISNNFDKTKNKSREIIQVIESLDMTIKELIFQRNSLIKIHDSLNSDETKNLKS